MHRSVSEHPRGSHLAPNANEQLKAGWSSRVAGSIVVAVALHVGVFLLWPQWERLRPESDPLDGFLQLEWVSVLQPASAEIADPQRMRPLGELSDSLFVEPGLVASEGTGTEIATLSEAFSERLVGRLAPIPTIVDQDVEGSDVQVASADESGSIRAEGGLTTADFPDLPGTSPLDLDRLSAVRPELVLAAPSAWVLVRNPNEVEQYILRSYRTGRLDRSANGSVSVALWIDERGSVEWAEISESSGRSDLDGVALDLFSEVAAFRPARDQGVPVARSVIFSVRFPWY